MYVVRVPSLLYAGHGPGTGRPPVIIDRPESTNP